jgi:hypothetical protein
MGLSLSSLWARLLLLFLGVFALIATYVFLTEDPMYLIMEGDSLVAEVHQFGTVTQRISVRSSDVAYLRFHSGSGPGSVRGSSVLLAVLKNGKRVHFGFIDARIISAIMENPSFRELVRRSHAGNGLGGADQ